MKIIGIFIFAIIMHPVASYATPLTDLSLDELTSIFAKETWVKITTEKGDEKQWRYPYFVGNDSPRLTQFNSWLRETSIRGLFPEDDALAEKALKISDRELITMLKTEKRVQDAAAEAATISTSRRFGTLFLLTIQDVYLGVSYYINLDTAIYDYAAGEEINIASLFVPEAEQEIHDLLAQSIRKSLKRSEREQSVCLMKKKKNPGYNCPESRIDIEQCIDHVLFRWSWLEIKDSRHLHYSVPYMPRVTAACDYEDSFELRGSRVERLFLEPKRFKKSVRFEVIPNDEHLVKEAQ